MPRYPVDVSDRKPVGGEWVSAIGLGTWAIRDYGAAFEAYVYALEHGVDNIDTAEMYDSGRAEEFVGRLLRRVGRENVFVTTKMLPSRLVSPDEVERAARASLRRLGVGYVDLFLIHWPNSRLSIEEQVRNFEVVYLRGYARYIGVSNFDRGELERALHATRRAEIVVDQVHYSVLEKWPEESGLLDYALENGVTLQAHTPLERGGVVGHPVVRRVAVEVGKTPVQVALNYLISRPRVVAIPKAERLGHVVEVLGAMGWRLPVEKIEELEALA